MSRLLSLWVCLVVVIFGFVAEGRLQAAVDAPVIATLSPSRTVEEGVAVLLEVKVNGTGPFTYQWSFEGTAITGATQSTYSLPSTRVANTGSYTCAITNSEGTTVTPVILLNVNPGTAPWIYYSGGDISFTVGSRVSIRASASGSPTLSYAWYKDGVLIPGQTTSNLVLENPQLADEGSYTFAVTNFLGSKTSQVYKLKASTPTLPTVSIWTWAYRFHPGSNIELLGSVSGSGTLSYQWYKDGVALAGSINPWLYFVASEETRGTYVLEATNSVGSVKSAPYIVALEPHVPLKLYELPKTLDLKAKDYLSLYANVYEGTGAITYQWFRDNLPIVGAVSYSLGLSEVTEADAGTYHVVVTNPVGSASSTSCIVSVSAPKAPYFVRVPKFVNFEDGYSSSLYIDIGGTAPFTYVWKKNGTVQPDLRSNYIYPSLPSEGAFDSYEVTVSNSVGSVSSGPIKVSRAPVAAPRIEIDTVSVSILAGSEHGFSVYASGADLIYQWYKNGTPIPGPHSSSFYLSKLASSDEGEYYVAVSNSAGIAKSSVAKLSIYSLDKLWVAQHPSSASILPGETVWISNVYLIESASNSTYQWYKDGVALTDKRYSSFYIEAAQPSDAGEYHCVISSGGKTVTSEPAKITVDTNLSRPLIRSQTGSRAVATLDSVGFSVNAPSASSYIWRKDGVVIPGASSSSFNIDQARALDEGEYTVEVISGSKKQVSRGMRLVVWDKGNPPFITRHPVVDANTFSYGGGSIAVSVKGQRPLTYQWYKDGEAISGATHSSLDIAAKTENYGSYKVKVTNANGSVESIPTVYSAKHLPALPVIIAQARLISYITGTGAYIESSVKARGKLTWEWSFNGGGFGSASTSSYLYVDTPGRYRFRVTNEAGSVTSEEIEVVEVAGVAGPKVATSPNDVTAAPGDTVTFSGSATGATSFAWRKNGSLIPGATSATLTLTNVSTADEGTYVLLAINADGTSPSRPATLKLTATLAPTITRQPSGVAVNAGQAFSVSVEATGAPAPTYQWSKNGEAIAGATAATYSVANAAGSDQGRYQVQVRNVAGILSSDTVTVSVYSEPTVAPAIVTQPQSVRARAGGSATFIVSVSGYPSPSIQWRKNGVSIAGANDTTYFIPVVAGGDAGNYSVVATNAFGSATSGDAALTVASNTIIASYSGRWPNGDAWGLLVRDDNTAIFIAVLLSKNQVIVKEDVVINADGSFEIPALAGADPAVGQVASLVYHGGVTGKIAGGRVSGRVLDHNLNFEAEQATSKATAQVAGLYQAVSVNTVPTMSYTLVGADGTAIVAVMSGSDVRGGMGTATSTGTVTVTQGGTTATVSVGQGSDQSGFTGSITMAGMGVVNVTPAPVADKASTQRLFNVATLAWVGEGERSLTAGLVIKGDQPKRVLIRAAGPGLPLEYVPDRVANTRLTLYQGETALRTNTHWSTAAEAAEIVSLGAAAGAFPFTPGSKDSAMVATLAPGNYTASVTDPDQKEGTGLIEVYEIKTPGETQPTRPRLYNLSTRGYVGTGGNVMIVGFVVEGTEPKRVLVRGVGPSLAQHGVKSPLADPVLKVFQGDAIFAENDDWDLKSDAAQVATLSAKAGAFMLKAGSKDAAIILYVKPGNYTAHLVGKGTQTGVGLIEVYEINE